MRGLSLLLLACVIVSGCSSPEATLPGVFTESHVTDEFRCGESLFAAGCVIVRVPHVVSGCVPEVPGYVLCNATVSWTATSGAVAPGSRLVVTVNGTEAGSCMPLPDAPCALEGVATFVHHFEQPGEVHGWDLVVAARLDAPGDAPAATGEFTLTIAMDVRTQDEDEAEV